MNPLPLADPVPTQMDYDVPPLEMVLELLGYPFQGVGGLIIIIGRGNRSRLPRSRMRTTIAVIMAYHNVCLKATISNFKRPKGTCIKTGICAYIHIEREMYTPMIVVEWVHKGALL